MRRHHACPLSRGPANRLPMSYRGHPPPRSRLACSYALDAHQIFPLTLLISHLPRRTALCLPIAEQARAPDARAQGVRRARPRRVLSLARRVQHLWARAAHLEPRWVGADARGWPRLGKRARADAVSGVLGLVLADGSAALGSAARRSRPRRLAMTFSCSASGWSLVSHFPRCRHSGTSGLTPSTPSAGLLNFVESAGLRLVLYYIRELLRRPHASRPHS